MLTHKATRRITLAHEPGSWIEVRMPSLAILDRAQEVHSRRAFEAIRGIDLDLLASASQRQPDATEQKPGSAYDWQALLGACIISWSYDEPATAENIAELDATTVAALMRELAPQESADDRKKDCASSTKH